jgi:2-polyprenyl-3-methyl-5-hydroxy-6-metoxy-1,4-benzoquinol methylase
MIRFGPNPLAYGRSYFFEEYKAQYGKTYVEDFPALQAMADRRLDRMERSLREAFPAEGRFRVLDIGCAYGAFLDRARARGWEAVGVDPSDDAIEHCRTKLSLTAYAGAFPSAMPTAPELDAPFHAVSLWFVIEHLDDVSEALECLRALLSPGGILALSTPSGRGVSARLNADSFWRSSPMDHLSILDPRSIRTVLRRKGFRLLSALSTGHHPERFPCRPRTGSAAYGALMAYSRAFSWGDTFEAYARREGG